MNSWQTLLMIQMAQGRYLATRPLTEYDWWTLWGLAYQMDAVNRLTASDMQ